MKCYWRVLLALALFCTLTTLYATVTPVRYYRLGDGELPVGGILLTTNSMDSVSGSNIAFTNAVGILVDSSPLARSAYSLGFPGTSRGSAAVIPLTANFCLEAWVKVTNTALSQTIIYNGNVSAPDGWGLAIRSGNFVGLINGVALGGTAPVVTNQWIHLALVYSNSTVRLFTNGVPAGSSVATPVSPSSNFFLGGSSSEGFGGRIDEVRVSTFAAGAFSASDLMYALVPVVSTGSFTNLTATNVVVTGWVNPSGNATTTWFEWGAGDRFDQVTTNTAAGAGFVSTNVSATLTNLVAGIPYQYRLVASNVYGVFRAYPLRFWVTPLTLTGGGALTNECHLPFSEPGVQAPVVSFAGGFSTSVALKSDGTVSAWGADQFGLRPLPDLRSSDPGQKVIKIASGVYHTLALRANGTVVGWGYNVYGQTDIPASATDVVDIAAGYYHSLALKADGTVIAWGVHSVLYGSGNSDYGQATVPEGLTNVMSISAGIYHSLALLSNGTVVAWGQNFSGQSDVPSSATNVIALAAGSTHSLALRKDGKIVAWGSGSGTTVPSSATNVIAIAARMDSSYSLCLRSNGTVVNWGGAALPSVNTNFVSIAQGFQGAGLRKDGSVLTWGVTYPMPADATNIVQLVASSQQTIGLRSDGSMVFLYFNESGYPKLFPASATNLVAISGARTTDCTLALRADGTAVSWGSLTGVTNVPAAATNLAAVFLASQNAYALRTNGTIMGWGSSSFNATNYPTNTGSYVALAGGLGDGFALRSDGIVVGWGNNSAGQANVPPTATNVTAIAAGYLHVVALRADRTVVVWGDGSTSGITNVPASVTNVVAIAAGAYFTLVLRGDGTVVGWGYDNFGNVTAPPGATNIIAIAAGGYHSAALRADGRLFVWGYNHGGQSDIPADVDQLRRVSYSGFVDTNTPGTYTLGYSITNSFGAVSTNNRTVVVVDRTPPVLTLNGSNPMIQPINGTFTDPGAVALDACGGSMTVNASGAVNMAALGNYLRTYVATDNYGNSTTNTRTVAVATAPSINGLGATILSTNAGTALRTVQLSALINPNGVATTVTFEYGLTIGYGGSVSLNLPEGYASTNVSVTILANFGASYHWRVSAVHSVGSVTSADQVITISSPYAAGDLNGDGIVTAAELSAIYANYLPTSPWLAMTNVAGLGGTNVSFALSNFTNENYSVEYSTNLATWYPLGSATPKFEFADTNAISNPLRYYRLHYP